MRPLVAVRSRTSYDPRFVAKSPLFWPIARAATLLLEHDDFPPPEALDRVFDGEPPVRFVPAAPRPRRARRGPVDLGAAYDARIVVDGCVPTRARSWHDLVNALVWGSFPRAKRALHVRQHRALVARVPDGARRLPPTRSSEQDALALIDEGGVVIVADDVATASASLRGRPDALRALTAAGDATALIFGHAIYESLVFDLAPAAVAAVVVARDPAEAGRLGEADAALARALGDRSRFLSPRELFRVDLSELDAVDPLAADRDAGPEA